MRSALLAIVHVAAREARGRLACPRCTVHGAAATRCKSVAHAETSPTPGPSHAGPVDLFHLPGGSGHPAAAGADAAHAEH